MGTDLIYARCLLVLLGALGLANAGIAAEPAKRLKIALTFDDLPLNGTKPAAKSLEQIARDTVAVLKKHHIPPSFGFVNSWKLESNTDGARALRVWIDSGNPLGNHTYSHMNLTTNSA